jgi:hypothetical protein
MSTGAVSETFGYVDVAASISNRQPDGTKHSCLDLPAGRNRLLPNKLSQPEFVDQATRQRQQSRASVDWGIFNLDSPNFFSRQQTSLDIPYVLQVLDRRGDGDAPHIHLLRRHCALLGSGNRLDLPIHCRAGEAPKAIDVSGLQGIVNKLIPAASTANYFLCRCHDSFRGNAEVLK